MLKQRIITALVIAPLFLIGLFATNVMGFAMFLGLIVTVGAWEWAGIVGWQESKNKAMFVVGFIAALVVSYHMPTYLVLGFAAVWWLVALMLVLQYPASRSSWSSPHMRVAAGLLILVPAWKSLVVLRGGVLNVNQEISTVWMVLYIFLIVWAADIGAYFAGKNFGKRKLAPNVSPGKSIEGAVGGLLTVSILPFVAAPLLQLTPQQTFILLLITLSAAIFSVVGDLVESMGKREVGIKDSSHILPGHGGIMDRIDSVTAAAPIFVLLAIATGWVQS